MNFFKSTILLLVYGRFSPTFHKHYLKDGRLSKHRPKYLRSCSRSDALSHYRKCLEDKHVVATFISDNELTFRQESFGTSFRQVRAAHPEYKCYGVEDHFGIIWKRIGYKERIRNDGVKRIFHFLDDAFFFGELLYADIRKIDLDQIVGALVKKYTGNTYNYDKGDIRINFKNGFIYLENSGIHVSIKYISTNLPEINEKLSRVVMERNTNIEDTTSEAYDLL